MKSKHEYILTALKANHGLKRFEDQKANHKIFNTSLTDYHIIISGELNGDELFRKLTNFLSKADYDFTIDLDSFLALLKKDEYETGLYTILGAIEYANAIPYSENKSINGSKKNHQFTSKYQLVSKVLVNEILEVAKARTFARSLQDTPSNMMRPHDFIKAMKAQFKGLNVKITVFDKSDLAKKKMNLILGVGQAAVVKEDQPALMIVEYLNNPKSKEKLALVGKGVCFDTGGLNIKTGNYMRWMKYDMSGAAIVGSTVYALAKNKIKTNVIAVMPLVLNLCGSSGIRPDDVIKSYSGITVEIDNTDAEGRLILADALAYATKDLKATKVLDIATLTGAMIYALGDTYTGVWATSDKLWKEIESAASTSGELVWRMPFHHDFKDLLKSQYADIANSVSSPKGGSIRAAMFLKEFTNNCEYGHFDIAGTGDKSNTGTGIMLNTFYNFAKNQ